MWGTTSGIGAGAEVDCTGVAGIDSISTSQQREKDEGQDYNHNDTTNESTKGNWAYALLMAGIDPDEPQGN